MKIFLSALETSYSEQVISEVSPMKWNLCSFYYLKQDTFNLIKQNSEQILIDSGAHSFQKGKTVNWEEYTHQYADWIQRNDSEKILGYFEMDVDNRLGFNRVKKLRNILEKKSDKIIPVWHKNRGVKQFTKMCEEYSGKIVAITGFKNEDIKDSQYLMFLKEAWKHNCKLHCLGMTRPKILDKVPFDYTDSSSWKLQATFYKNGKQKLDPRKVKKNWAKAFAFSYKNAMKMQEHYYRKWRRFDND